MPTLIGVFKKLKVFHELVKNIYITLNFYCLEKDKTMSLEAISAHIFLFYLAGQETTGGTAAFTLFELAQYPQILKKAQDEVLSVLSRHNGQVTYDSLKEMTYLELCIQGNHIKNALTNSNILNFFNIFRNSTQISWSSHA